MNVLLLLLVLDVWAYCMCVRHKRHRRRHAYGKLITIRMDRKFLRKLGDLQKIAGPAYPGPGSVDSDEYRIQLACSCSKSNNICLLLVISCVLQCFPALWYTDPPVFRLAVEFNLCPVTGKRANPRLSAGALCNVEQVTSKIPASMLW